MQKLTLVLFGYLLAILQCAVTARGVSSKIVNGYQVNSTHGFEHQVSLRVALPNNQFTNESFCGGSLIRDDLVLTAAHCLYKNKRKGFYDASNFVIVVGNIHLAEKDNNTLVIRAKQIVGHSEYNDDTHANDIALIFLSQKVPVNHTTAKPIAMTKSKLEGGKSCVISGWGTTTEDGKSSSVLRSGDVIVRSRTECNKKKFYAGTVLKGMFCAGNFTGSNLVDTCQGDSGGPLVCDGVLVGITSSGNGCARKKYPGIYVDINHYRKWIDEYSADPSKPQKVTGSFIKNTFDKIKNWFG